MLSDMTKGPWTVEQPMDHELWIVVDGLQSYDWAPIATLPLSEDRDDIPEKQVHANAQAISALPELIEALRDAREALHFHYVEWDGEPEDAVPLQLARSKCDSALAKAGA